MGMRICTGKRDHPLGYLPMHLSDYLVNRDLGVGLEIKKNAPDGFMQVRLKNRVTFEPARYKRSCGFAGEFSVQLEPIIVYA